MREQADLFGEIHEDELVKIAWEAAEKRGYAVYDDYNEYMKQLISQEKLKPTDGGRYQFTIRDCLLAHGWEYVPSRLPDPARFYPPGTDLGQTNQLKL